MYVKAVPRLLDTTLATYIKFFNKAPAADVELKVYCITYIYATNKALYNKILLLFIYV